MDEAESFISAGHLATAFDELRVRLSGLEDGYAQLYEMTDFLSSTLENAHPTSTPPYLLELHDDLRAATAFRVPPEANPIRLHHALIEVERWRNHVPEPASEGYGLIIRRLQQEIMINAALMGDFNPAGAYLGVDPDKVDASEYADINARTLLELVKVNLPGWNIAVGQRVSVVLSESKDESSARFPAVYSWSDRDARSHSAVRGHLCDAHFRIGKKSKGKDDLTIGGTSLSVDEEKDFLRDVARAGRRILGEVAPEVLAYGYTGTFKISSRQARLEGRSMRALLAALYAVEVIRFSDRRTSMKLDPSIVVSGDINGEGHLVPVDAAFIASKVEATFFSRAQRLVVPLEHLDDAREVRERLQQAYPKRSLTIHGIETIFDIFADRRFVVKHTKSRSQYAMERTWKHRTRVVSTAAVLLVFSALFLLNPNRIDPYIVRDGLEDGGQLNFLNETGETVHSVAVGARTYRDMSGKGARYVVIGDVNGDGFNDAFWSTQTNFESSKYGEVTGIDGATGDTLLNFTPDFMLRYPNDISIQSHDMVPMDLALMDTNGDDLPELIVAFEHVEYYPSILATFNPLTGDVLQRYDHPGALREMLTADINADGRNEILLSGINNSMRMPVFIVLDPTDFSDTGPVTRESYKPLPERIGKELAYFTFPRSPISNIDARLADWINVLPNGQVTISVWDAYGEIDGTEYATSYRVTFDEQLRPISLGTSNDWDGVYQEAAEQGRVPADFNNRMKLDMLSRVERIK